VIKNNTENLTKIEEMINFYDKYLALDNDTPYLLNLVKYLAERFIIKIPENKIKGILLDENFDITKLRYDKEDHKQLSYFDKLCINFISWAKIYIEETLIINIDRFGTIGYIESDIPEIKIFEGKNILEYLNEFKKLNIYDTAKEDVANIIMQNILVSKIYNAIKEVILRIKGQEYAEIFSIVNEGIINYENKLKNKKNEIKYINTEYQRVRSNR